jgi:hypothetical protein
MMAVADPQSVAGAAVGLAGTIPHQGARTITDGFPGRAETVTLRRPKWPDGLGRFPKPSSASGYFDVIRFWLKSPLDSREGSKLRNLCGGEVRADREPAPFPGGYQERITMRQPLDSALKWLAERDDVHINYAEIALDWTFESSASRDNGWQFIGYHLVRRHHGKKQEVRLGCSDDQNDWTPQHDIELAQTRYDGPRSARNLIVLYKQEVSRKTGEIPLLHLEWRANGAQAVRSLGIVTPADLIQFDYRRFRYLLLTVQPPRAIEK